jgi:trehalose-6-phosphatase
LAGVSEQQDLQSHATPKLDIDTLVRDYKSAKKRIMFFDYDVSLFHISLLSFPHKTTQILTSLL